MNADVIGTSLADTFESIVDWRQSCRGFQPDPLPDSLIKRILRTAQKTPSWCNTQPWNALVVSGEALKELSATLLQTPPEAKRPDIPFPASYEGAYQARRRECGFQLYDAVGVKKGDREAAALEAKKNLRFFGAPHLLIVSSTRDLGPYGPIGTGLYVANFLLATASHRVATIALASLASYSPLLHKRFSIPESSQIVCGIAFGYMDEKHPANNFRTTRAPLDEVVTEVS